MDNLSKIGRSLILLSFILQVSTAFAADKDYRDYHKGIINAEQAIFIDKDGIKGLQLFKQAFDTYDFVYIDDCIEAFQIALVYNRDDYAMQFIKKAIENGFELKLLHLLSLGCTCNQFSGLGVPVTIYNKFIDKNRTYLEAYEKECYPRYIKRINKDLVAALMKRHVREQLYKNYHTGMGWTMKEQLKQYTAVCDDNLRFMDSLAKQKIFVGEQNLGLYSNKQVSDLRLPTMENCLAQVLGFYGLPKNTEVPIHREGDYFEMGYAYNMQFHNTKTYDSLSKYKDEAIRKGYLHPREYASLRFNDRKIKDNLYLVPGNKPLEGDTTGLDDRRRNLVLPTYAIDYNKHVFQHKYGLQLSYGMFFGTR